MTSPVFEDGTPHPITCEQRVKHAPTCTCETVVPTYDELVAALAEARAEIRMKNLQVAEARTALLMVREYADDLQIADHLRRLTALDGPQ